MLISKFIVNFKNLIKLQFILCFVFLFFNSCTQEDLALQDQQHQASSLSKHQNQNYQNGNNYKTSYPTRNETLQKVISIYNSGQSCSGVQECEKNCNQLYSNTFIIEECKKLPIRLVDTFFDIYKAYQSADIAWIQTIKPFDLKAFLAFEKEPLLINIKNKGKDKSEKILKEIAYDWELAQVFLEQDLDYSLLENLLREFNFKPIKSLRKIMDNGRTFQEIAILKQNDAVLSWVHGFFNSQCQSSSSKQDCVLGLYCSVSADWPKDTLEEFNEFKTLKTMLHHKSQQDKSILSLKQVCSQLCSDQSLYCKEIT